MKHPFVLILLLSVSVTGIAATIKVPADQPTVQAGVNGKIDMGVYEYPHWKLAARGA